jgi:hypothetical protein
MRDAHARALESGLAWRPIEGSEHARPAYELRPGTGRRGPEELWARFDRAVEQLNAAGAGDSLADVVAGYAAVADAATAMADALEAAGESTQDNPGSRHQRGSLRVRARMSSTT